MTERSKTGDTWCTPLDLARLVGWFDLDPCSNPRSHIRAGHSYSLENGEDGLGLPWFGSVWCNPPYSCPLPWARRLADHNGPWCALVKLDPSTRWWATLMEASPTVAPFRKRIKFEGDRAMTAPFPCALVYSAWRPSRELAQHLWLPVYTTSKEAA